MKQSVSQFLDRKSETRALTSDAGHGVTISPTWRQAVSDDVAAINATTARSIRALHAGSYEDVLIEEAVQHAYGVDWQLITDGTYFVAEVADRIVGAGGWSFRKNIAGSRGPNEPPADPLDPKRDAARIRAFYVEPAASRSGVGSLLLQASETCAYEAGFKRSELTSTLPAAPFYKARGYVEAGPFDLPLPSGASLRLLRMWKRLED